MDEYRVKLPTFEGPLDLLLHLVRKNEYDIFDIPIAAVTEQYLEFLDLMKEMNLEIAGEYLLMSATLMKIKSAMLLPRPEIEGGEDGEDPRAELVRQILEYERYREAAYEMEQRAQLGRDVFARKFASPDLEEARAEPGYLEVSIFDLMAAFKDVLKKMPKDSISFITPDRFSLRQRMTQIIEQLSKAPNILFESLFDEKTTKSEVIVTFLAILELIRLLYIRVYQERRFAQIHIMSRLASGEVPDVESGIDKGMGGLVS